MKKAIPIVVLVLVGSSLAYCFVGLPTYSWHQKMTVEVQVDEQVCQFECHANPVA